MHAIKAMLLDQLLVVSGHIPHHPVKGMFYDRLLSYVEGCVANA
jgi:hypothetical protein